MIGYKTNWNIFSHEAYVVVGISDQKIRVRVDSRQMKYIEKEHPPGSDVYLKLENNNWFIVSKPSTVEVYVPEQGVSYMDVLDNMKYKKEFQY